MSDSSIDEDDFAEEEEELPAEVADQIRRLQLQVDQIENVRKTRRHRGYRMRRRIEEWSDRRALRDSVDYLEDELDSDWRSARH
jgi:hypothetical protein